MFQVASLNRYGFDSAQQQSTVQDNAPIVASQLSIHDFTHGTIATTHKEDIAKETQLDLKSFKPETILMQHDSALTEKSSHANYTDRLSNRRLITKLRPNTRGSRGAKAIKNLQPNLSDRQ